MSENTKEVPYPKRAFRESDYRIVRAYKVIVTEDAGGSSGRILGYYHYKPYAEQIAGGEPQCYTASVEEVALVVLSATATIIDRPIQGFEVDKKLVTIEPSRETESKVREILSKKLRGVSAEEIKLAQELGALDPPED